MARVLTSFTLSFILVPMPLCNLCDSSEVSRAWSKEMSGDHKEINIMSLLNHCVSMPEAWCEYMKIVLRMGLQNTSKTLPNHRVYMREPRFCTTWQNDISK